MTEAQLWDDVLDQSCNEGDNQEPSEGAGQWSSEGDDEG